jgi:hypothetical protein
MDEKEKILLKIQYKAKKAALRELIEEFKDNDKIVKKLKEMLAREPVNV